jgi:hypothetical protein
MGDIVEKGQKQDMVERRQKQKELLDGMRRKAEAAMTAPERLELDFLCTATRKGFVVHLERKHGDRVYKVVEITKKGPVSGTGSGPSAGPKALDVNVNEIEHGSIKCPHCDGGRWSFIKCGCGMLSCAGGVKEHGGKYLHVCPWCGTEGYVQGEIEKVSGRMLERGEIPPGAKSKNLSPPTRGMLNHGQK